MRKYGYFSNTEIIASTAVSASVPEIVSDFFGIGTVLNDSGSGTAVFAGYIYCVSGNTSCAFSVSIKSIKA